MTYLNKLKPFFIFWNELSRISRNFRASLRQVRVHRFAFACNYRNSSHRSKDWTVRIQLLLASEELSSSTKTDWHARRRGPLDCIMAYGGRHMVMATGGENFLLEWTIKNFSSWSKELHQLGINSPRSEVLPNLTIALYPSGTNGNESFMTLLFTSTIPAEEGSLCGDVTLSSLNGRMLWKQRVEWDGGALHVLLLTNLEFHTVAQYVWGQGDKIVLRYRTTGPFGKKEELRTNIFELEGYITLYPKDLLGLDTTGMKLGSVGYQLADGQREEIELLGVVNSEDPSKISLLLVLKKQVRVERPVYVLARLCAKRDSKDEILRKGHLFRIGSNTAWVLGELERKEVGGKLLILSLKITPRTGYTHFTISPQKKIKLIPPKGPIASTSDIDVSRSNLRMPAGANGYDQGIRTHSGNIDPNKSNLVMPTGASGYDQGIRTHSGNIDRNQSNLVIPTGASGYDQGIRTHSGNIDPNQSNLVMPTGASGYDQGIRTHSGNIDTNRPNLVMPAGASGHDQGMRMSLSYIDTYQPNLLTRARVSGHYDHCATSDNIDANRPNLPTSSDVSGHDQELRANLTYMYPIQLNLPTPDSVSEHDPRGNDFQSISGEGDHGHNEFVRNMLSVVKCRLSVHDQGILTGSDNSNTNQSNLPMPGSVSEQDQGIRTSAGNIDSNRSDMLTSNEADDILPLADRLIDLIISRILLNSEDDCYKLF